jgi:acyl-CoA thioesterase FadM
MGEMQIQGRCHCGNLSFTLHWVGDAEVIAERSCGCSFCKPRGATWASIPGATLEVAVRTPALVSRYTFATHTAVLQVCARCGAVPLSTSEIDGRTYAVVNVTTLTSPLPDLQRQHSDVADESLVARLARRKQDWIADVCFTRPGSGAREPAADSFSVQRTILFGDCDPGGVVYSPRVADFVVEAALEFMSKRLGVPAARNALQTGVLPPARLLSIEYLQLMAYDDRIEIRVEVEYVGEHSYALAINARKLDQTLTFRARLVQVCIAADTLKPITVPASLRAALEGVGLTQV